MKIAVAKGDGIGPEIMEVVIAIFNAAKVPMEYEMVDMGKWVFDKGFSNGMTPEAKQTIEDLGILFKGPMLLKMTLGNQFTYKTKIKNI
jgi:isocitrate dehydrogenase